MGLKGKKREVIKQNSHFVYEIDHFSSELIQKCIKSEHNSTEIHGFEQFLSEEYQENYVILPSLERLDAPLVDRDLLFLREEVVNSVCYELILSKPSFFPLYAKDSIGFLDTLQGVEGTLFTQVLFQKKSGKYRVKIIPQYEDYLSGNDYPSESKAIRLLQGKMLSVFNKFGEISQPKQRNYEMEDKICGDNFQFEMRFVLVDGDKREFEDIVTNELRKMNYHNELQLARVRDTKRFIEHFINREFQYDLESQWVSEQELMCLLSSEKAKQVVYFKPTNPNEIDLPVEDDRDNTIDQEVVDKLVDSFKRTKITDKPVEVHQVNRGATLQKVTLKIPGDIVYTNIEKNIKNIQASLGNENVSVEIGTEADTVDFYVPMKDKYIVYLKSLLDCKEFQESKLNIPLLLGEDSIGNPLFYDLSKLAHILIAGATGSGKSVYLNSLNLTLLLKMPPEQLQLILIDPKQVELGQFKQFPQVTFIDDMDKAVDIFSRLVSEMENRYELFASKSVKNIQQYNSKFKTSLPYMVCVVDELADLFDTHGADIEKPIIRLGQKARAAGIHLVLCTQRPSSDVINSRIKANLPSAISFRLKSNNDYRTVFGKGIPYNLLGAGDGVAMIEGSEKEFIRFQAPVITLDQQEEEELFDKLISDYGNVDKQEFEVDIVEPIDELKKIIATTGETRVSVLREQLGIRMSVVSELVRELVEEGWLVKDGKGYRLVASEDTLNEWREDAE